MNSMRNDDRNDHDKPPFSRLFVVCSKQHTKDDLKPWFEKYGQMDDIYMPRDRATGTTKGIAFVKYNKTSSAAAAIEALHLKVLENGNKPIKVMVSSSKSEGPYINEDKFKRLFIKVNKNATEDEITEHFSRFGVVAGVHLQKDRATDQCRGFAYVNYNSFLEAATAFEECDSHFKPIFATPKDELKRSRMSFDDFECQNQNGNTPFSWKDDPFESKAYTKYAHDKRDTMSVSSLICTKPQGFDTINVTCSPPVQQRSIEQLFNIIPGLISFKYTTDYNESRAVVKYESKVAAAHALESLNYYEFPSGEIIVVKPFDNNPLSQAASNLTDIVNSFKNVKDATPDMMQLAEAIAQASSLIKAATSKDKPDADQYENICGVKLPPQKPLSSKSSPVAQRCFVVFKPQPPPIHVLQNVFCRFGDLIDVSVFPNKTFGFVKYASSKSAQEAMATLHGVTLYGILFKVVKADEKPGKDDKMNVDDDEGSEHDVGTKRAKLAQ